MSDKLYTKIDGNLVQVKVEGSGVSGGTGVFVRATTTLTATLTAGTAFAVPVHDSGSDNLLIYLDGLLCSKGESEQYQDLTDATISFNDDIPAGSTITAVSLVDGDTIASASASVTALTELVNSNADKTSASLATKLDTATYESEKTEALS